MATKAVATLTNTGPMEWVVTEDGTGTVLVKLVGPERLVLDCAAASMVADHGYPNGGGWQESGPGQYSYAIADPTASSSSAVNR